MSLKLFHVPFVVICVLFAWGFGAWCLLLPGLPEMFQWMGWASVAGGAVLLVYGVRFLKKMKSVII